jgi:hypothetical protein
MTNISLDALAAAADRGRRKGFRDLKLTEPPAAAERSRYGWQTFGSRGSDRHQPGGAPRLFEQGRLVQLLGQ